MVSTATMTSKILAKHPPRSTAPVRILGIGASAGGLEAIEAFLAQTSADSGLAYVVVQHLDPSQKSLLPALLQRITTMPVYEATQNMRIEANSVYVIPSNRELSIVNNLLKLAQPVEPRGMRLPINVLFSSLASARGESAIAVVLSGMGCDGTMGLQAIKAVGGLTVAQEPGSAQFDSMPASAIAAGCADIIGAPAQLPALILGYVKKIPDPVVDGDVVKQLDSLNEPLQSIMAMLRQRARHDFSLYKLSTLMRRIERRMAIHGIGSLSSYADYLQHNTQEIDLLFKELLIGVTSFFRDPAVWDYLAEAGLPALLKRSSTEKKLRAWSVGCSTGEEAYSLAMVFQEVVQKLPKPHDFSLQIFASDLSPDAIAAARQGKFPLTIEGAVSSARLTRFFSAHETHYQLNQNIRDMVLFAQHDVILDPPFTKLDLIICRNLLIYFDSHLQRRLLPLFHYSLRPGGLLVLGSSETVGRLSHLFTPMQAKLRFYLRQNLAAISGSDFLLTSFPPLTDSTQEHPLPPLNIPGHESSNLQTAADQVLLQVFSPAAVLVNNDGDIVYISGRTGKYLEPAAGKANWNFYAMVREDLRGPMFNALKQAQQQSELVKLHGLEVSMPGGRQIVDITVQTLQEPLALRNMTMVVFHDVAALAPRGKHKTKSILEKAHATELQQCRDEIHALREETRASREKLQAANEELQSTNEELQSTNEELTTSKEEMQSMNEELQTINAELQSKLDDLSLAQSDMQNVLNSTEIAILFLDQHLNVRRYTERATKIVSLREIDIGRPLSDLSTSLEYPEMHEDALQTLRTLAFSEKQIVTTDDRWFSVRIMPYRRLDNVIDGVVITFVEITEKKGLESNGVS